MRGIYGARGPNGEVAFDPEKGVLVENLGTIGESRILNGKVSDNLFPVCTVIGGKMMIEEGDSTQWRRSTAA